MNRYGEGYQRLWGWFGLTRANFLTLSRAMMHEMPDEWQSKMAALLEEWGDHWPNHPDVDLYVSGRRDGKFAELPEAMKQYRHPDSAALAKYRGETAP